MGCKSVHNPLTELDPTCVALPFVGGSCYSAQALGKNRSCVHSVKLLWNMISLTH